MTLQIAAICDTGWVMASDRMEQIDRTSSSVNKIFTDDELGITYAVCGSTAVARLAARELIDELRSGSWPITGLQQQYWLETIADKAWRDASATITTKPVEADNTAQGITIFFHNVPTIGWALYIGQSSLAQAFSNKRVRADYTNPAICFFEKYYSPDLLPRQLAYLAAHSICIAPYWNKSGIEGLDITIYENENGKGTIHRMEGGELTHLKKRSDELDHWLTNHFDS